MIKKRSSSVVEICDSVDVDVLLIACIHKSSLFIPDPFTYTSLCTTKAVIKRDQRMGKGRRKTL